MTMYVKAKLANKHAIVTGGARGIGAAISSMLSTAGANVTIMGRDRSVLERHAKSLGDNAVGIACDVTDETSIRKAFDAARTRFGDAHILVNNAGQAKSEKFGNTTRATWDTMLAANLTSVFLCTQQVLPAMLGVKAGRIVNIASTAGPKGEPRMSAYAAAKHGVVGLTRSLAARQDGRTTPFGERVREWWDSYFAPASAFVRQPRFAMSFGMIFFSFSMASSNAFRSAVR